METRARQARDHRKTSNAESWYRVSHCGGGRRQSRLYDCVSLPWRVHRILNQCRMPCQLWQGFRSSVQLLLWGAVGVAAGAVVWVAGWLCAHFTGFGTEYLTTSPGYLWSWGAAWSIYWNLWAVQRVPETLAASTAAVRDLKAARNFRARARWQIERFPLGLLLTIATLCGGAVFLETYLWHTLLDPPHMNATSWAHGPYQWAKDLIVFFWAFPAVYGIVGNFILALKYARLVKQFEGIAIDGYLVDSVWAVREGLRRLCRFARIGGTAWNVGVLSVAIALVQAGSPWPPDTSTLASGAVVVALSLIGAVMLWPEYVAHRILAQRKERSIVALMRNLRLQGFVDSTTDSKLKAVVGEPTWIYGYSGSLNVVGQIFIPVATFALGVILKS